MEPADPGLLRRFGPHRFAPRLMPGRQVRCHPPAGRERARCPPAHRRAPTGPHTAWTPPGPRTNRAAVLSPPTSTHQEWKISLDLAGSCWISLDLAGSCRISLDLARSRRPMPPRNPTPRGADAPRPGRLVASSASIPPVAPQPARPFATLAAHAGYRLAAPSEVVSDRLGPRGPGGAVPLAN